LAQAAQVELVAAHLPADLILYFHRLHLQAVALAHMIVMAHQAVQAVAQDLTALLVLAIHLALLHHKVIMVA
jgi:hypothetical protein